MYRPDSWMEFDESMSKTSSTSFARTGFPFCIYSVLFFILFYENYRIAQFNFTY